MNKCIVFYDPDMARTRIVYPMENDRRDDETEDEFLARVKERAVPKNAQSVSVRDTSELPADRTFRNALTPDLKHDMAAARDIQRERIREARKPLLAALDVEYQRADESGDASKKRDIAKRKQALRDATKDAALEAADTPEKLKDAWPAALTDLAIV